MLDREFQCKPSRFFLMGILGISVVSSGIAFYLPVSVAVKFLCCLLVFCYGGYIFWQYGILQGMYSIVGLRHQSDGLWLLKARYDGFTAELMGDSTVTRWVSVLRFRIPKRFSKKTCILFYDSLPEGQYRELLVRLRMF